MPLDKRIEAALSEPDHRLALADLMSAVDREACERVASMIINRCIERFPEGMSSEQLERLSEVVRTHVVVNGEIQMPEPPSPKRKLRLVL